ncbi:MAG TPA: hypothetical protein PKV80_17035 [Leptospiraceae bacterium]|nr:hypothetical protein [Leptospiraceae bacterium]HNF26179.1 hypothetical protein [Leptospiraceae bacterium]HNI95065.1 hypothetical protein [Leptospiraceae bacterium]HNO24965.1 hypothetical protein [Leptospiraceae bacterium]
MPGRARVLGFLKEMPSEKISEISIEPLEFRSLVSERIVITDKKDIEEISSSIRKAEPYFFNHPTPVWTAAVRITTVEKEEFGGTVISSAEESQGVNFSVKSGIYEGFMYQRLKNNDLGPVIEKMAAKYRKK